MKLLNFVLLVFGLGAVSAANYNYSEVIGLSLLFYEAQRTGVLPPTNRIPWRGDSFVTDIGQNGEDLTGAGDHVKFGFPAAGTMTLLSWGMYDSKRGYEIAGEWRNALDCLRWGMDYMIKTHPSANFLYIQVGDTVEDHNYWGRPEEWTGSNPRPTLRATTLLPSSECAAEQSAAMAAASMVFKENGETAYGATLLMHAEQLYSFATTYRGNNNDSFPGITYSSWSGYGDEFLWAAAWLYRATGREQFKEDCNRFWTEFDLSVRPKEVSWDNKLAGAQVLLAKIDGSPKYVTAARNFCDWVVKEAPKTPLGLVYLDQWGAARHAANAAFVCLQAASAGINTDEDYIAFAKTQIDYVLGDCGRSLVVGYGFNPPQQPHHRAASCPDLPASCSFTDAFLPGPNPQILYGALVGGPDINDGYEDDRSDYVRNEVALDYNAGFQSALASLNLIYSQGNISGTSLLNVAVGIMVILLLR
ncbi:hypothetical protein HA402_014444 [Bradysia odoriphaga]|nr:hypothetical protein HA402_014444 [Bradysia odoriphaga]